MDKKLAPHTEPGHTQQDLSELREYMLSENFFEITADMDDQTAEFDAFARNFRSEPQSLEISNRMYVLMVPEGRFIVMTFAFIHGLGYVLNVLPGDWQGIGDTIAFIFQQDGIEIPALLVSERGDTNRGTVHS